jgi:hypothetical protein
MTALVPVVCGFSLAGRDGVVPPWEAIRSEPVEHLSDDRKQVAQAWLVTLRDSITDTEHTGRVEVMESAARGQPELVADLTASQGTSAYDRFLNDQQPPLLIYLSEKGLTVPHDGVDDRSHLSA